MMKVLAVTNMYPNPINPRSGTFVFQQVNGLRSIGVDVEVCHIPRDVRGMKVYISLRRRIISCLNTFKPDVIHIMYGGIMAFRASSFSTSYPIVLSLCGTDIIGEEVGSVPQKIRGWIGVFGSRYALKKTHYLIVKSKYLLKHIPHSFPLDRVSVIPNGVNLNMFIPMDKITCQKRLGWNPESFHIVFSTISFNDANKRLPLARSAVERLKKKGLSVDFHIMVSVPHEEVPVWLNAADCVLLTSSHEGSPNIVKEALACNRPVVSVDVGDVREMIEGVDHCYIAEPEPQDIADKLYRVYRSPRVNRGREKMKELSIEKVAYRLVTVYERARYFFSQRRTSR